MEERYGIIYKITNLINNKVYIGQTTKKGGFNARYYGSITKTHNAHLKRAIEKYGIENFEIDKEFYIAYTKDEINKKEIEFITLYKSTDPNYGYNIRSGGDNTGRIEGKNRADILLRLGRPIICKTTYEIFLCVADACDKYNIGHEVMRKQCNGFTKFKKDTFYNKELDKILEFEYYYNDEKGSIRPIICCNTEEIFKNGRYVSDEYSFINKDSLRSSLWRKKSFVKNGFKFMNLYDWIIETY